MAAMQVSELEWAEFLAAYPHAHLLQTAPWGELKAQFSWQAERLIEGQTGAQILFRQLPLGFTFAYLPKGPIGPAPQSLWPALDALCRKKRAIFLKVEPDAFADEPLDTSMFAGPDFKPSSHFIQPPRTITLDIASDEDSILQTMKSKTRYNIRLAERKEVSIRTSSNVAEFSAMMEITGERDAFGVHSLAYYQRAFDLFHPLGLCQLLIAEYKGQPLAGLMVFIHGRRAWYLYGASTNQERNRMPTYLLQWEAIRWAKAQGCSEYDLWGVPDEDEDTLEANFTERSEGLWGVYRFKRGFGGQLRRAVGVWDRVYDPFLYELYSWRYA
jgi:lipid II:glycine glycyltransferase (peptidoglycan interpeptide bridge formation enzyme)